MQTSKPAALPAAKESRVRVPHLTLRGRRILLGYLLILPVLIWRSFDHVYPFLRTIYLSFTNTNPMKGTSDFIGLDNYIRFLNDPQYQVAMEFTFIFTFVSVAIQVALALGVAELLNREFRLRGLVRAVNLLPWAMTGIVVAVAAQWAFSTDYGMVSDLYWRLTGYRPPFMTDASLARISVIAVDVWKNTPFLSVIFLSGLQGISKELYESADIDGAGPWSKFIKITLPLLTPLILTMSIFVVSWRLLTFELVYGMTAGGPGQATMLISYAVYRQAFGSLNFGYAAAMSMSLFVLILGIGLVGIYFVRSAWAKYY